MNSEKKEETFQMMVFNYMYKNYYKILASLDREKIRDWVDYELFNTPRYYPSWSELKFDVDEAIELFKKIVEPPQGESK